MPVVQPWEFRHILKVNLHGFKVPFLLLVLINIKHLRLLLPLRVQWVFASIGYTDV